MHKRRDISSYHYWYPEVFVPFYSPCKTCTCCIRAISGKASISSCFSSLYLFSEKSSLWFCAKWKSVSGILSWKAFSPGNYIKWLFRRRYITPEVFILVMLLGSCGQSEFYGWVWRLCLSLELHACGVKNAFEALTYPFTKVLGNTICWEYGHVCAFYLEHHFKSG